MNVTFRQLRLFLALAETGSVSGAAKVLHVTQPTASMQLKEISQAVGLPLYEVIGKKVHLTDVGQELAATARAISATWESFEQGVDAVKGLSRGKLRIAVVSTAKYFVPRLLGRFCESHPHIDISLEVLNRDGVVQRLRETDVPVIAAVQGVAVGAGMALSLAADVRFGTPQTAFHVGSVKIGISAGECGISYHLPRLVGAGRAFELMLTGRPVLAQEALSMGLVSDLVPEPELMERAMACARSILALAPYSVTQTKRIMWRNLDAPDLASALELENQVQVLGLMTDDFSEAVQAFVHKRPARFSTP